MFSEPSDFGFSGTSRYRTWIPCAHRELTTCVFDPYMLKDSIQEAFKNVNCQISDYLVASKPEIMVQASELAARRSIPLRPESSNLKYLMTPRERQTCETLDARFHIRFRKPPWGDRNLVYFLGDDASYTTTWSGCSGKLPTMRCNSKSALFWLPSQQRPLTSKELLVSMGWPCVPEVAARMGVPIVGASDPKRAADLLGNSMHFTTAGIMQLITLACFAPARWWIHPLWKSFRLIWFNDPSVQYDAW